MTSRAFVLGILLVASFAGCRLHSTPDSSATPVTLPVISVARKTLPEVVTAQGMVSAIPDHSVKLSPVIAGKIARVWVTVGQNVTRNQMVAELDARQIASQVKQAEASLQAAGADVLQAKTNLQLATNTFEREGMLVQSKIAPQKDLLAAQSQMQSARAALEAARAREKQAAALLDQARTQLELTKLRTPISGVVGQRFLNVGDSADPSTPVVTVVELSTVVVNAGLPADSPVAVKVGDPAQAITSVYPNETFSGRVWAVSPIVDLQTNAVNVQVRFPNPTLQLKEGLAATVLITAGVYRNVLAVPSSALVPDPANPKGSMVYQVKGDTIERVPVEVGVESKGNVEIIRGLHEGENVVARGGYGLPDGTRIQPVGDQQP